MTDVQGVVPLASSSNLDTLTTFRSYSEKASASLHQMIITWHSIEELPRIQKDRHDGKRASRDQSGDDASCCKR